jgi:lactate racemase
MPEFTLLYGRSSQNISIPESYPTDLILPAPTPAASDPLAVMTSALDHPLDFDYSPYRDAKSVSIAVNDKTRPVPHEQLLPPLLRKLKSIGIQDSAIHIWIATGSHLPLSTDEISKLLPHDICKTYTISSHNIDHLENLVFLGNTSRDTPIWVNQDYFMSDLKIVVGDIEPHHFAGFSGGMKSAAIGLAGRETINHNHAMLVDPNAWIGVYEQNPLRQDIEEIGNKIGVQLALNTILNHEKQVVAAFSGNPQSVMKAGIPIARLVCGTPCSTKYDLVIASAGGHPKDINFYQAQKALTHASLFCREGGTLILSAACNEGTGSESYEKFMQDVHSVDQVFDKFKNQEFRVGPHKAFQVARLLSQFRIFLVSNIPVDLTTRLLMQGTPSLQEALDACLKQNQPIRNIAILPHATTTIPNFSSSIG